MLDFKALAHAATTSIRWAAFGLPPLSDPSLRDQRSFG
jgi:hypothetical protein